MMDEKTIEDHVALLIRGTEDVIDEPGLRDKLVASARSGRPLRVKAGFDPTAPDIHLGHAVLLRKLRQFQDLGHHVYFIIGDFTARIGDPTGRDVLRPRLEEKTIAANAQTYQEQAFQILDPKKTKVLFNSSWLGRLSSEDLLGLTAQTTVAQMLARADFKKRFQEQKEISLLEFIYPLLQGYDSIHIEADIECGGVDQRFNLLMGRELQAAYGQPPQVVLMTPLLEGLDGVKKMSKSLGNTIGIQEPPQEIFGKMMSISDDLMKRYYEVLTDISWDKMKDEHPKKAKLQLAEEVTALFHSRPEARRAREAFEKVFSRHQLPDEMPEVTLGPPPHPSVLDLMVAQGLVSSRSEGRRLFRQGAVSLEGETLSQEDSPARPGVLRVGKRRFLHIKASS